MRELYVGQRTEEGEDGQKYCFDYYILVDQMCVSDGFACESYGTAPPCHRKRFPH